jgi:pimeloyl-ACP methyl ester carboxylesterase
MSRKIIYVHGMWEGKHIWPPEFLEIFAKAGYEILVLTLHGYESRETAEQSGEVPFLRYRKQVEDALREAGPGAILCGHSLGGLVVQSVAARTQPKALILVSSAAPLGIWALRSTRLAELLWDHKREIFGSQPLMLTREEADDVLFNRIEDPVFRSRFYDLLVPASGRQAFDIIRGIWVKRPKNLQTPTLVLCGTDDAITPIGISKALARRWRAEHQWYEGRGHMLPLEPGCRRVAEDIVRWLRSRNL